MEQPVPILSPQQIESLSSMVRSIQAQNQRDLEELLSERCEIQHTTIINLYNLAVEEWASKQKVLENLCHFTLTIMATLSFLWERRQQQDSQLCNAQALIQSLQKHIADLNEQSQRIRQENEELRQNLRETQNQLILIPEPPQPIEFISCAGYSKTFNLQSTPNLLNKQCSEGLYIDCQLERVKSQLHLQSAKLIEERELQIETLRQQHQRLQEQYSHLQEEHRLTKMEVELAELAIKEALNYKSSYLQLMSHVSKIQQEQISKIQLQQRKSDIFDSQQLQQQLVNQFHHKTDEYFEDLCPLNSHVLLGRQVPDYYSDNYSEKHQSLGVSESVKPQEQAFGDDSLIKMAQDNKTSHQSPNLRNQKTQQELGGSPDCSIAQSSINCPTYSAVILQSSVDLTFSSKSQKASSKQFQMNSIYSSNVIHLVGKRKSSSRQGEFAGANMRKQILKRGTEGKKEQLVDNQDSLKEQSTIGRLYNLLSMKLVSNRIRTK